MEYQKIITDNSSHFVNAYISLICSKFKIKHNHTSAHNPQANGLVKWLNQMIANSLKWLDPSVKQYWDNFVPATLYAYWTLWQSTTKCTPFYLTYRRNHNPLLFDSKDISGDDIDWIDQLQSFSKVSRTVKNIFRKSNLKFFGHVTW